MNPNGYTKRAIEDQEKDIGEIKTDVKALRLEVQDISRRLSFIYGGSAAISVIIGITVNVILKLIK